MCTVLKRWLGLERWEEEEDEKDERTPAKEHTLNMYIHMYMYIGQEVHGTCLSWYIPLLFYSHTKTRHWVTI